MSNPFTRTELAVNAALKKIHDAVLKFQTGRTTNPVQNLFQRFADAREQQNHWLSVAAQQPLPRLLLAETISLSDCNEGKADPRPIALALSRNRVPNT